jgi:hypothetical protein
MANDFRSYGGTDDASLGRAGFGSKEFNEKGRLQDSAPAPLVSVSAHGESDDYDSGEDTDGYDSGRFEDEDYQ